MSLQNKSTKSSEASVISDNLGVEGKIELIRRINKNYSSGSFNGFEKNLAEKIFNVLAGDAELKVRQVLARNIRHSNDIPKQVVLKLANDVIDVSEPILISSKLLNDDDLIQIASAAQNVAQRIAIAVREVVSPRVSEVLVSKGENEVIKTLVNNHGAQFTEQIILQVMENYKNDSTMLEALTKRGDLPLSVVGKMVEKVSGKLKGELIRKYHISPSAAESVVSDSEEIATLELISRRKTDNELGKLISNLHKQDKLKPSIVIKALCMGDISFFERGLAKLADIPEQNAAMLIRDKGEKGFKALYTKAKLPASIFEAIKILLALALKETNDGKLKSAKFTRNILEMLMESSYMNEVPNMSYVAGILARSMKDDVKIAA